MPGRFKVSACLTFALAVVFYLFFDFSKHNPALSQVNAFADDPYDAVGSFAVQFAVFAGLLALIRAFRPYRSNEASTSQKLLLVRAVYLSCLSVVVTLSADIVAMVRHPAGWVSSPATYALAALVGGMALLTVLLLWFVHSLARTMGLSTGKRGWIRAVAIAVGSVLILGLYPENWRGSLPGELLTVVVGAAFLFVPLRAIDGAMFPDEGRFFEDVLDDLAAVYQWLKAHAGPCEIFCELFEWLFSWSFIRLVLGWLNPRKHSWHLVILLGVFMGLLLFLGEMLGEGGFPHQIGQTVMVVVVFMSLECVAVVMGYGLLARPMGLFRHSSGNI